MGYLTDLTACTDPVSGDFLLIADASAGATDRDRKVDIGKFALLGTASTFTINQVIAPTSTSVAGLTLSMPASTTGNAWTASYNSSARAWLIAQAAENLFRIDAANLGNNVKGAEVRLGRNSSASTNGGAPGILSIQQANGAAIRYMWPDDSGNLRIHTSPATGNSGTPTVDANTAGVVVGTQTSHASFKNVTGEPVMASMALRQLSEAARQVRRFVYKDGSFGGQEFSGLILDGDELHRYGMDADAAHPAGKSLNVVNLLGDLLLAVEALTQRVEVLEAGA